MLANASKAFFHLLAKSDLLKQAASRYGMRSTTRVRAPVHRR